MSSISDPDWVQIFWLADCYAVNGMYSEALAEIDKIRDLPAFFDDADICAELAWIWAVSGYREEALRELDKAQSLMARRNADSSFYAARVYAGLGENDRAFECLDQAYERHSVKMVGLISDYELRSLHGDPRFEELAKKIGFPVVPGSKKGVTLP